LAKKFENVKLFQNEWTGFAEQRKFALSKTKNAWVFSIDADERCTEELKNEIVDILRSNNPEYNGYRIPRKSFFFNKFIKHCGWYPGYQMRLFNKKFTEVSDRLVHEGYVVEGRTGYLKSDILHYTVNSISEYLKKINHYSTLEAEERYLKRKVKFGDIFFRPITSYLKNIFIKGALLDGIEGLMVTNFDIITNMLTYMKIWEKQRKEKS